MPTITVLTPVHNGGLAHPHGPQDLHDLYECLAEQKLPADWRLEWVVQEDGRTGKPLEAVPDDPWISKDTGPGDGAARARTRGLARATGTLLRCLDADDLLPDQQALNRDIEVLETNPSYGWTVAPRLDLHPDGRLQPRPCGPPPGPLQEWTLLEAARRGELPGTLADSTLTARTDLLRIVIGWSPLSGFEHADAALLCEAVSLGWMQTEPGAVHREPDGPDPVPAAHREPDGTKPAHRTIVISEAEAMRANGWRFSPTA
jgi:hypothetical protein